MLGDRHKLDWLQEHTDAQALNNMLGLFYSSKAEQGTIWRSRLTGDVC